MSRTEGTLEGVRRANLSRILRMVHREGPLSRAALTDATGLNRSTIGALVTDLTTAGLVQENAPDAHGRVGRPSPNVAATAAPVAVAVNPEVDAVTMAAISLDRTVIIRERIDVEGLAAPDETARLVAERIASWRIGILEDRRIAGLGVALPGLVRSQDGLVRLAPHLNWRDAPLLEALSSATGIPSVIDNDATLGALAESLYGAAQDVHDSVYLNGGASGIGGGIVIDGRLVHGARGYAGEIGQNHPSIALPADRRAGANGTLEDEVSRARLLAAVRMHGADDPTLASVIRASAAVDVTAEVERQRRILSTALANVVNVLNPSVVVLGGFLATLFDQDPDGFVAEVAAQAMPMNAEGLAIRTAALGEDRLLVGAAEIAFEALLEDPLTPGAPWLPTE
ncbi:putative NBD/HSP70 family sugar kinase [Microbacterium resistens]|uniref:NBD/HSP70 family sugar kinase n=1 Tax=Microbacterium resistens TaxID=156977 RepID=A0ABU1SGU2_9MICO|nr:ROK family transcriptional regulator [Microbacterium resistens]MDR6868772.1 putative NBD/HSP70 family sugar kinase [Microbacterium resistens]